MAHVVTLVNAGAEYVERPATIIGATGYTGVSPTLQGRPIKVPVGGLDKPAPVRSRWRVDQKCTAS